MNILRIFIFTTYWYGRTALKLVITKQKRRTTKKSYVRSLLMAGIEASRTALLSVCMKEKSS